MTTLLRGDALTPECVQAHLRTKWLGQTYRYVEQIDSTNLQLAALADQGEAHGTVLVADAQTRGRGRFKRKWHSPAGTNVYFSALLRPAWDVRRTPPLSLAAGVALAEAVTPLLPAAPTLKWPNDVLFEGRKLGGILVEAAVDQQSRRYVVVGIGLNINTRQFPAELCETAGSLYLATGSRQNRASVLAAILGSLEFWVDRLQSGEPQAVIERWHDFASWLGREITVRRSDGDVVGIALGVDAAGRLLLRDVHGQEIVVVAGDVLEMPDHRSGCEPC